MTKPVVAILRGAGDARTIANQLSSEISLNYYGQYSRHAVDVQPALINVDANRSWDSVIATMAYVFIVPFDHRKPESFAEAQNALCALKIQNSKVKCLCVCFGVASLSIEDMVYYDIVCSEMSCQFMVLESETCGHQLSELFGSYFPQLKNDDACTGSKKSWPKLRKLLSRSKSLRESFDD